jgi:rubrerythrin
MSGVVWSCPDCGTDLDDDWWCPACEKLFSPRAMVLDWDREA